MRGVDRSGPRRGRTAWPGMVTGGVLVVSLVLAGCTSSDRDRATSTSTSSTTTTPAAAAPQAPRISAAAVAGSFATLDQLVTDELARTGVPGAAVAVVHGDQVVYAKGYGLREAGKPDQVDADTVFQLASLSKPFGSAVVAGIVDDGKVSWDDPVTRWDPTIQLSDPWVSQHATIGDFYSHRTGLPGDAADMLAVFGYDQAEVLRRLRYLPVERFRDSYSYNNMAMTAGGVAAARGAGTTFADAADQELFGPAGMTSSSFRYDDFVARKNRTALHVEVDGSPKPVYTRDADLLAPAGGASSNVKDMATWMRIELAGGKLGETTIIKPDALLATQRAAINKSAPTAPVSSPSYYGYGWDINHDDFGLFQLSHSGAFPAGAATTVRLLPTEGFGIVVLTNGAPVGAPEAIADGYIDQLIAGRPTRDWPALYRDLFQPAPASTPGTTEKAAAPAPPKAAGTYVGTYANDFLGTVTVAADGTGKLVMAAGPNGTSTFALVHLDGDTFGWDGGPAAGGAQLPARFTVEGATATTLTIGDPASPAPWFVLTRTG